MESPSRCPTCAFAPHSANPSARDRCAPLRCTPRLLLCQVLGRGNHAAALQVLGCSGRAWLGSGAPALLSAVAALRTMLTPLSAPLPLPCPQIAAPDWGNWLDVYLTALKPLPFPTGGLLGSTYKPPKVCPLPPPLLLLGGCRSRAEPAAAAGAVMLVPLHLS